MRDLGHEWTEERIRKLEARIRDAYEDAVIDIEDKMNAFCAKFAAKDRDLQAKLKAGKITKADYQMWLAGQVFQRERWQRTLDDLTATLARANQIAMQIINEETPEVFAYNANWASYTFEREMDRRGWDLNVIRRPGGVEPEEKKQAPVGGARVQFGWGLYSTETVKILLRDEPDLLPPSRVDIPKDKRWNMKNITRQIMQGIVQGEGVEQVAARLRTVAEMNIDSARTHARTAMTGAQNAGRWEELIRERDLLERFGTTVRKKWKSAKDSRVRESHGILDGQVQELDDPFEVKGKTIMFPGDPDAAPELVYNCRCTMSADYPDSPPQNAKMRDDDPTRVPIRSMTFKEWMEWKEKGMPLEKLAEDAQDAVPVKKITFAEKYAEAGRDFVEAKTIAEAEEYAQRFVASYKSKYSGNVSYKGMDVNVANDINRVLTKIYELFDVEPLRNIKPMNKRENQWKDTTAEAAYQWFQGDLFINATYYKNAKTIANHRAEVEKLTRQVMANVDTAIAYAQTQEGVMARKKLAYVTALKKTGRSNVGHIDVSDIITHEMGHMLDDRIFRKGMQTKGFDRSASYEKYAGGISAYATADGKEYIAESFAAWAIGDTDCLDPEVIAMFEEAVRWEN